jgi:alpha-glucoside transport system permease protein
MAVAEAEAGRPAARAEPKGTLAQRLSQLPINFLLAFIGLLWLIPAAGLFVTSILPKEISNSTGWWHFFSKPSVVTWDNYDAIFHNSAITHALWVTALVTAGATVLPILIASLAGYALAWIDFPGRDYVFVTIVGLMVVPIQMALIPIFSLYNKLNLFDTIPGLVLFHTAFALPFGIFLLRNFFAGIPRDLMEAARIDGASEWRLFFKVVLPLGLPAIAALAIFQVLFVWNDFLIGFTLAQDNVPIAPALAGQLRQFSSNLDIVAPASFFSAVIPLTIFAMFQRYFVQGLLAGSVK